jgi:hypothetical protein
MHETHVTVTDKVTDKMHAPHANSTVGNLKIRWPPWPRNHTQHLMPCPAGRSYTRPKSSHLADFCTQAAAHGRGIHVMSNDRYSQATPRAGSNSSTHTLSHTRARARTHTCGRPHKPASLGRGGGMILWDRYNARARFVPLVVVCARFPATVRQIARVAAASISCELC